MVKLIKEILAKNSIQTDNPIKLIQDDKIDLKVLLRLMLQNYKTILWSIGILMFIGILYSILCTPLYKSTITMYPLTSENDKLMNLQKMAATVGFDVGGTETSFHIPDIVNSERIAQAIIKQKWNTLKDSEPVDLISFWDINNNDGFSINPFYLVSHLFHKVSSGLNNSDKLWEQKALEILNARMDVYEEESGLVRVNVWMEESQLAADVSNYIYDAILNYTLSVQKNQAKLNREFIQIRQAEVKGELSNAEEKLKEFRDENRFIQYSPQLQLELARLEREVQIQTEVYITLQQQYELARIEEVKQTPSVVILDHGRASVYKDKPKRKLIVIISILLGAGIGISLIIFKESYFPGNSLKFFNKNDRAEIYKNSPERV